VLVTNSKPVRSNKFLLSHGKFLENKGSITRQSKWLRSGDY
jgi:hypothetical protein